MKQVIVGFSRPRKCKLGSLAIRAWQGGTPYSHVYLRLYSQYTQQWLVYQASHGMVHLLSFANFSKANNTVAEFTVQLTEDQLRHAVTRMQELLGQPYGYLGLIRLVLSRVLPVSGDGSRTFHCSELIATLFPEFAQGLQVDFVEPVHLFNHLSRVA